MNRQQHNEYHREYKRRRYQARRQQAIEKLGGCCAQCGRTSELEVDHVDPATKSMDFDKMYLATEARFLEELGKCQLLCKPCHTTKTVEVDRGQDNARMTHGTVSSYRYCKCQECCRAHTEYMRRWRRQQRGVAQ